MQVASISEQLFFTTVRIDTVSTTGVPGAGTGFLFAHKVGDKNYPFVVTNKHVVAGQKSGVLTFVQKKDEAPSLGNAFRLSIDDWPNAWFGHPEPNVDIAVCPFAPLENHIKQLHSTDIFYRTISSEIIPSAD